MENKKKLITTVAVGVLVVSGLSLAGVKIANAANDNYGNGNASNAATLVEKISSKFSLSQSDVQGVVDEVHTVRQQQRKADRKVSLDKAVSDGVITQDQENAIVAKRDELRQQGQHNRDEMQKWMSDNGINEGTLHSYMGGGHGRGMGNK